MAAGSFGTKSPVMSAGREVSAAVGHGPDGGAVGAGGEWGVPPSAWPVPHFAHGERLALPFDECQSGQ